MSRGACGATLAVSNFSLGRVKTYSNLLLPRARYISDLHSPPAVLNAVLACRAWGRVVFFALVMNKSNTKTEICKQEYINLTDREGYYISRYILNLSKFYGT